MEALFGLLIFIGLCVALMKGIAFVLSQKKTKKPQIAADWQPPEADPLPYAARENLLSLLNALFTSD